MSQVMPHTVPSDSRTRRAGFSVIELLVVVAIIIVIAAISVPPLVNARMKAHEAAAVASLRTINSAEVMYANAYPSQGYSVNLVNLGSHGSNCESPSSTNACMLDDALASGIKGGYIYELTGDGNKPEDNYLVKATPEWINSMSSGRCAFSSDSSGSIQIQRTASKGGPFVASAGSTCQ